MKSSYLFFLLILLILVLPAAALAGGVTVLVNGEEVNSPFPLIIRQGQALVPLRPFFEAWGADLFWEEETGRIMGVKGDMELLFFVGSPYFEVNGAVEVLDVPSLLLDGRTYVPLRATFEVLGGEVNWDGERKIISVISQAEGGKDGEEEEAGAAYFKIDMNKASSKELEELLGLEEALAEEIVAFRREQGLFRSFEDFCAIPGVDDSIYELLQERVKIVFTETGVASWYGGKFHGRRTTSGEVFDQHGFTAAHRYLPFGTLVKVTFLGTGKSTWVRINDRGPHISSRIIDLSRGAASAIGLTPYGLGEVRLKVTKEN